MLFLSCLLIILYSRIDRVRFLLLFTICSFFCLFLSFLLSSCLLMGVSPTLLNKDKVEGFTKNFEFLGIYFERSWFKYFGDFLVDLGLFICLDKVDLKLWSFFNLGEFMNPEYLGDGYLLLALSPVFLNIERVLLYDLSFLLWLSLSISALSLLSFTNFVMKSLSKSVSRHLIRSNCWFCNIN